MAQHMRHDLRTIGTEPTASDSVVDTLIDTLSQSSRYIALFVAWVAMSGSLFFSEVLHWQPCVLCWYQRILMYPLAIIIAVGILRRDERLHLYVLPLSTLGAGVSLYHYLLVKTDWLPPPPCVSDIPCTVEYLNWLGFINIPFLALTAFLIISFMMVAAAMEPGATGDAGDQADSDAPSRDRRQLVVTRAHMAVFGIIGGVVAAFIIAARFV